MVSVSHANAQELFERDVECIVRYGMIGVEWLAGRGDNCQTVEEPIR